MIVEGWLDWITRIDGIADKVYSEPNAGTGIACHSVVGEESEFQDGVPNRFLSTDKEQDPLTGRWRYTAYAAASCMFVLRKSGELIQMHPITASTWTSGGYEGNTRFWAIEAEGGQAPHYGELLTQPAEDAFVRLVTEWENHTGVTAEINVNILQHKQIAKRFGYDATACASDRYSNAWARINEGERYSDDMTPAEVEAIVRKVFDEVSASYYRTLTAAYWDKSAPGAYSAEPDPGVVAGIAKTHKHSPKGKPGVPA